MAHQRQSSSGSSYDPPAAAQYYQHQGHLHQQPQQQTPPQYYMPPMGQVPPPPPLQHHHDPPLTQQQSMHAVHAHMLQSFWMNQMHEVENVPQDYKLHHLPLARIKKVMKTDEDVKAKMISAEAPLIFDKACEVFITELTIRAWIHAEENKRRTLQRSDIAAAITKTDMFDFLIDIVPREDKTAKEPKAQQVTAATAAATGSEPRQSQESFPPVPTGSSGVSPEGPFEGYGYPYGVIVNGSFALNTGEPLNPYQQQQHHQQQLQLQYMRAQMAAQQESHQHHPARSGVEDDSLQQQQQQFPPKAW